MHKPYFYIIKHLPTQLYYAGCKYSNPDSNNFMTESGYQTSSKIIKNLISRDGLSAFEIVKIKFFDNAYEVLRYESRFLNKVDAKNNDMFINRSNGDANFRNKGGYKLSEKTRAKMSKPKSLETIEKQNDEKRNRSKETYQKMVSTRKERYSEWVNEEQRKHASECNKKRWSELENREIQSQIMIDYYKQNPISEETKQKHRENNKGDNNPMFGRKQSEETRKKMSEAWARRKAAKLALEN